jgi:hypothetical protein
MLRCARYPYNKKIKDNKQMGNRENTLFNYLYDILNNNFDIDAKDEHETLRTSLLNYSIEHQCTQQRDTIYISPPIDNTALLDLKNNLSGLLKDDLNEGDLIDTFESQHWSIEHFFRSEASPLARGFSPTHLSLRFKDAEGLNYCVIHMYFTEDKNGQAKLSSENSVMVKNIKLANHYLT